MDRFVVDEPHIWAMFYAGIVSIQYHPRNPADERMTLVEMASLADAMYDQYVLRKARGEYFDKEN